MGHTNRAMLAMLGCLALSGQTAPANLMGTLSAFRPESAALQVTSDSGSVTEVRLAADTLLRRVQPGERDLKNAEPLGVADLAIGDRLLITLAPDGATARRVVVMPATAIVSRNEADRKDWIDRGVTGVVERKKANEITLRVRSMTGETLSTVVIDSSTRFRRYLPGSVKFSDAQVCTVAEVTPGDQMRARGKKSPEGLRIEAEDVVFGTFQTRAGTVLSIDQETRQIKIRNSADEKVLTVTVTGDSQLKKMPSFGGAGGPPIGAGSPRGPGGPPDLTQMVERMPAAQLQDIKVGETIVVSSTKGARPDQLTAIMLLANAELLVRMAAMQGGVAGQARGTQGMGAMGGFGAMGGMGGIELPGMMP